MYWIPMHIFGLLDGVIGLDVVGGELGIDGLNGDGCWDLLMSWVGTLLAFCWVYI